jgi:hypothetical protein
MSKALLSISAVAFCATITTVGLLRAQDAPRATDPPPASDRGVDARTTAPQNYRAKQILGSKVSLDGDREAGTVDDIVFGENGAIDYLVVVNSDSKLVTVPWEAARFNAERRTAVIHIAPERFQEIPTYTAEQYPSYWAPTYRAQIYKYYGLTPRQERRMIRRDERRRD